MPEVAFVMSASQDNTLRALAETVCYELQLQGVPSSLRIGSFSKDRPQPVHILLDPMAYAGLEGEQALPGDAVLRRTIFLCAEAPPLAADDEHQELFARAGSVFALDQRSVVAFHRIGIRARLLRPGYSKSLDHFDPEPPRPIDVLFLGALSQRRSSALDNAARVLSDRNCQLEMPDEEPKAEERSSCLAEGRWPLLTSAKVLMNFHRDEQSRLEWRHVLDAIHAGTVVVTEHSSGISPLVPGEHLLVASADSLPYVVEAVLRDEHGLARMREQAYARLSTWLPYALPVSVLRAAIVELVGEPEPPEAALSPEAA